MGLGIGRFTRPPVMGCNDRHLGFAQPKTNPVLAPAPIYCAANPAGFFRKRWIRQNYTPRLAPIMSRFALSGKEQGILEGVKICQTPEHVPPLIWRVFWVVNPII